MTINGFAALISCLLQTWRAWSPIHDNQWFYLVSVSSVWYTCSAWSLIMTTNGFIGFSFLCTIDMKCLVSYTWQPMVLFGFSFCCTIDMKCLVSYTWQPMILFGLSFWYTIDMKQGWAPLSFPFRTFRSFPFFQRTEHSFQFFFWVFGDLWNPKERSVLLQKT